MKTVKWELKSELKREKEIEHQTVFHWRIRENVHEIRRVLNSIGEGGSLGTLPGYFVFMKGQVELPAS